jgi:hypothetical protein
LSLDHALAEILVTSEQVGGGDGAFHGEDDEVANDAGLDTLLAVANEAAEAQLDAGNVGYFDVLRCRPGVPSAVVPVRPKVLDSIRDVEAELSGGGEEVSRVHEDGEPVHRACGDDSHAAGLGIGDGGRLRAGPERSFDSVTVAA